MASALKPEMRVRLLLGDVCCWGTCLMHKQLDVKNYFYSKECCLGASLMDKMAFPFLLTTPGTAGRSSRKRSGCARNSKELIVGWEQPRLQLEARSLVVLTRM